jgi:hypothetical protein
MAGEAPTVPTDDELKPIVLALREARPSLGIAKLLAQLKADNPTISVSEKRLRKVLQPTTASATGDASKTTETDGQEQGGTKELIANTGIDKSINWSIAPKVKVKMFKSGRGKGLVAREKILEGEVIWSEDPWIATTSPYVPPSLPPIRNEVA